MKCITCMTSKYSWISYISYMRYWFQIDFWSPSYVVLHQWIWSHALIATMSSRGGSKHSLNMYLVYKILISKKYISLPPFSFLFYFNKWALLPSLELEWATKEDKLFLEIFITYTKYLFQYNFRSPVAFKKKLISCPHHWNEQLGEIRVFSWHKHLIHKLLISR